jgi:D-tyrosyl-tRNA(Tyr) deacylase
MRFVIQRVLQANVKVSGKIVGEINQGILVFIGLTHADKYSDIDFASNKLLTLRLWDDEKGTRWKECVKSKGLEVLLVSQFTLYSILKGNKPDFHGALEPGEANKMYEAFVNSLKIKHPGKIQTGLFGEMMEVSLVNDGPVTINWEYPEAGEKNNENYLGSKSETTSIKSDSKKKNKKNQTKNKCIGSFPITEEDINRLDLHEKEKFNEIGNNNDNISGDKNENK